MLTTRIGLLGVGVILILASLACFPDMRDLQDFGDIVSDDLNAAEATAAAQLTAEAVATQTAASRPTLDMAEPPKTLEHGAEAIPQSVDEDIPSIIEEGGSCAELTAEECAVNGRHDYVRNIASCAESCGSLEGPLTHEIIFDGDTITVLNAELGWEVTFMRTKIPNRYVRDEIVFLTVLPDGLLWENYGTDDGSLAFSYWDELQ